MGGLSTYCSVTITPKCSGLKQQACFSLFLWGRNRERLRWGVLAQGSYGAAISTAARVVAPSEGFPGWRTHFWDGAPHRSWCEASVSPHMVSQKAT